MLVCDNAEKREEYRRIRGSGACALQGKAQRHAITRTHVLTHEPSFLPPSVCECVKDMKERDG